MSNEDYKNQIIKMVKQIQDESTLRRIYLILVVIVGEVDQISLPFILCQAKPS